MNDKSISVYISGKNHPETGYRGVDSNTFWSIGNRSLETLNLSDSLDYVPRSERKGFLSRVAMKMKDGGIVSLKGVDIKRAALEIIHENLSCGEIEALLLSRLSVLDVNDLKDYANVVSYWTDRIHFHAEITL